MSTPPSKPSIGAMAVPTTSTLQMATVTPANVASMRQNDKTHRRSRSGCYICRLRRKKCDEGKPRCKACRNLGLECDYNRPMWWSSAEQRRRHKEIVKEVIRKTKLSEKAAQMHALREDATPPPPPPLSHSAPSPDTFSDVLDRTRAPSVDSQFSGAGGYDLFNHPEVALHTAYGLPPELPGMYDANIKTEQQAFIDDIPAHYDASLSSFGTFDPHHSQFAFLPSVPADVWPTLDDDILTAAAARANSIGAASTTTTATATTTATLATADAPESPPASVSWPIGATADARSDVSTVGSEATIVPPTVPCPSAEPAPELDQSLLDHFAHHVQPLTFPILELHRPGFALSHIVQPSLETNTGYLHCCLGAAALHMKATCVPCPEPMDGHITRHQEAAVEVVCEALKQKVEHDAILEAGLGMIYYECLVGLPDDRLQSVPWHMHFQAVSTMAYNVGLFPTAPASQAPEAIAEAAAMSSPETAAFSMALTSWVDILGATILGRSPLFAHVYREKHRTRTPSGLCELMGCDDQLMYLISEMAALDALKSDGFDDLKLCKMVHALALAVGETEPPPDAVASPYAAAGAASGALVEPQQLMTNLTAVFRVAARLYLCSLVPGYDRQQPSIVELVKRLADLLEFVPAGPAGFDRALVWPYLMAGAAATPGSLFRQTFESRIEQLGAELANSGSFGRVVRLLREVWRQADAGGEYMHWRQIMQLNGWDELFI